jgi:hypothetical protein
VCCSAAFVATQAIQPLLSELQGHPPGSDQQQQLETEEQEEASGFLSEKLTMLLLLQEPTAWGADAAWADGAQRKAWQQLLDASAVSILEGEVAYLRQQLKNLEDVLQVNGAGSSGGAGGGAFHSSCSSCTNTEAAAPAAPAAAAAGGGVSHCGTTSAGTRGLATQAGGNGSSSSPCKTCEFSEGCSLKGCMNEHGELVIPNCSSSLGGGGAGDTGRTPTPSERYDTHGCCP